MIVHQYWSARCAVAFGAVACAPSHCILLDVD
jgi:hypothetical protein